MKSRSKQQRGRVLILVLVIIVSLSAFWIIALSTTSSELLAVAGRKQLVQPFYSAESGLTQVLSEDRDPVDGVKDFISWLQNINSMNPDEMGQPPVPPPDALITALRITNDSPGLLKIPQYCPAFDGTESFNDPKKTPQQGDAVTECYAVRSVSGGKTIEVGVRMKVYY